MKKKQPIKSQTDRGVLPGEPGSTPLSVWEEFYPYSGHGELDAEGGAFAGDAEAFDPDAAVHGFDQAAGDIQAQSGAAHGAVEVAFQTHKALEESGLVGGFDAFPVIGDAEDDKGALGEERVRGETERRAVGRVL